MEYQLYNNLRYREKRTLFKNFNKNVYPRNKVWIIILLFAFCCVLAGFSLQFIYLYSANKNDIFIIIHLITQFFWWTIYGINLKPMDTRNKKFFEWLKAEKNIIRKKDLKTLEKN